MTNKKESGRAFAMPKRAGQFIDRNASPRRPFLRRASLAIFLFAALLVCEQTTSLQAAASNSIARVWNEQAIAAIRIDTPNPPVQARNLFSLSVCMYDVWAAYDTNAVGFVYHGKFTSTNLVAERNQAISYAAYRMLKERHVYSRTATNTLPLDDAVMANLGYDGSNQSRDTSTPAGIGNTIYDAVSAYFINDGANQTNGTPYPVANPPVPYPDSPVAQGGYVFTNPALAVALEGITDGTNTVKDINQWQRLLVANSVDQNGFPQNPLQKYLGAQWLAVRPFQLARINPALPWIDPGPPPLFGGATQAQFVNENLAVMLASSQLTPNDGVMIDISPASIGSNSLGYLGDYGSNTFNIYDGKGYTVNPVTGQPYASNVVPRGDAARVISEYWADGPNSETPPGHWNVLANKVGDNPSFVKRMGGTGPVVDDLEWDVKIYFSINAALHEAACSCWAVKRYYNSWRPLSAIRYLAGLGQSSDSNLPSYNPNGLPLVTNLIELVTVDSVASGRHAGLTPGKIAVFCWPGQPLDPTSDASGVVWEHGDNWVTYQKKTFVTPAFPGYISGHSTFSRAGAEILTAMTGSPYFPGGLGTFTVQAQTGLKNEVGPSQTIQLQWATYYDAADQAGISRIWGGIHAPVDNVWGRRVGATVGQAVWQAAQKYFDGSIVKTPVNLAIHQLNPGQSEVRFNTVRAMYYKLQSTTNLAQPFTDVPGGTTQALNSSIAVTNSLNGEGAFFRAVSRLNP